MRVPLVFSLPHRFLALALCLGLLCFTPLAQAATRNVPSTAYPTIQAAVDAAANGDTVRVADGTYSGNGNRDIGVYGKSLIITSVNGPTKTIIDCGGYYTSDLSGNHRGFRIGAYNDGNNVTVSGFTVKNGYINGGDGGGISTETDGTGIINITNCIVTANTARNTGGGIYNFVFGPGTINLTNCTVTGNATTGFNGGGIENLLYTNATGTINVNNCTVNNNTSANSAGGINNENYSNGTINITNCTVNSNTALNAGGIYNDNISGSPTTNVTNCTVNNNASSGSAGGISNINFETTSGTVSVNNCTISGNTASFSGGGIYNSDLNPDVSGYGKIDVTNCTISGNVSGYGGGIYNDSSSNSAGTFTVTNCILTANTAYYGGAILYSSSGSSITNSIVNCTIFNNTATYGYGGSGGIYTGSDPLTVTNTILYGDTGGEISGDNLTVTYSDVQQGGYAGTGNINADPLFASSANLHLLPLPRHRNTHRRTGHRQRRTHTPQSARHRSL